MAKTEIKFEACLQQSTPAAKPVKFAADGSSTLIFEVDASDKLEIIKLLAFSEQTFMVTIKPSNH